MKAGYAVILGNLGNTCDRFLSSGYKDQPDKAEMLRQAAEIDGVTGIELVGTWDVTEETTDQIGEMLEQHGLKCVSIIPDLFSQKRWGNGSYAAKDPAIREQAIEETAKAANIARKLGCPMLNIWPGQDGYDYSLQADFRTERRWFQDAVAGLAREYSDIRFALEYKPKEPRTHSYIARAADTLLMVNDIDLPNVGVTIDVGHALYAYENVAESVVLLSEYGNRLFHMHFNDNYRYWDDDMIVGSVHLVEYVELIFWLREVGYTGWYSMDQYPYREDAQGAIRESIEFLKGIERMLDETAMADIRALIASGDAVEASRWMRSKLFRA